MLFICFVATGHGVYQSIEHVVAFFKYMVVYCIQFF